MDAWAHVFRLAARQHSAIARSQALGLGVSNSTFTRRVRREEWPEPHRGVFVTPGSTRWFLTEVSAALLAARGAALATAETALLLRGVTTKPPRRVDLVVPHDRRAPKLAGVQVIRSRTLTEDDRSTTHGLSTVTAARAFLDSARSLRWSASSAIHLRITARSRRSTSITARTRHTPKRGGSAFASAGVASTPIGPASSPHSGKHSTNGRAWLPRSQSPS